MTTWPPADSTDSRELREQATEPHDCDHGWVADAGGRVRKCPACRPAGALPRAYSADQVAHACRVAQRELAEQLGFLSTQELAAFVAAARRQETAQ